MLDRPGARLTAPVWWGLLSGLLAVALAAVSIPVLSALYGVFVPVAFLIAGAHAAALVLAVRSPGAAVALSAAAVLATAVLTITSTGLPWPLPVPTMVGQLLVCALVGLGGDRPHGILTLLVSLAAASVPLLIAVVQGELWSVGFGNLVTFGAVGVLVTALALAVSPMIPAPARPTGPGLPSGA